MNGLMDTWRDLIQRRRDVLFLGRQPAIQAFRLNFVYKVPAHLIFALHGPPGIGKSALVARYRAIAEEHGALTVQVGAAQATPIREQTIVRVMVSMAQQLARTGTALTAFDERYAEYTACMQAVAGDEAAPGALFDLVDGVAEDEGRWSEYLAEKFATPAKINLVKRPVEALTEVFVRDLNAWAMARPIVLCFDDWERLASHAGVWLQGWLRLYEMRTSIWAVIAGADPLDSTWEPFRPVLRDVPLRPFAEGETRACLAAMGVTEEQRVHDVLTFSEGLPALVRLLGSARGGSAGDLALTPVDRYLKWLDDAERREVVLRCAVPRRLDVDVVAAALSLEDATVAAETLEWLRSTPLLEPAGSSEAWAYHPALRSRLVAYAQQQSPRAFGDTHRSLHRYHRRALDEAEVPSNFRDVSWRRHTLEALYHGLMVGDVEAIHEGVETFLRALRRYYPLAAAVVATWQEAAAAQLTENRVTAWGARLQAAWEALESQAWEDVAAFCETVAHHEDANEAARKAAQSMARLVGARFAAPEPEAAAQEPAAQEPAVSEADTPAAETPPAISEPEPARDVEKEAVALKETERKQKAPLASGAPVDHQPPPEEEPVGKAPSEAEARVQKKDAPLKEDQTALPEVVTARPADQTEVKAPKEPELSSPSAPLEAPTEASQDSAAPETQEDDAAPAAREAVSAADYASRANVYLSMAEYQKAVQEYTKALELDPAYAVAYFNRGLAWMQCRDFAHAVEDYSRVIDLNPRYASAYYHRGMAQAAQGELAQAIADYDEALALDPDNIKVYNSRGNAHFNAKAYQKAIGDYDQALKRDALYVEAYLNRGLAYASLEEYQQAIADYNQVLALEPEHAVAYVYRGMAYVRLQQYPRALEDYEQALALNPQNAVAYNNRGLCYVHMGEYDEALAQYRQAVAVNPQFASAYYNAACAAALAGNAEAACGWLEQAIERRDRYRDMAQRDTDFDAVRGHRCFKALVNA